MILKQRLCAAALALCLLSGCGAPAADGESVREYFSALTGFEAHIKVLSDLEDSVLEYEMDYNYNRFLKI